MNGAERGAVHHSGCSWRSLLLLFVCPLLFPQAKAQEEVSPERQPTCSIKVDSVVIRVTVTDRRGNPVTDLTERDFRVYDDGKLQEIQTFALESTDIPESEKGEVPDTSARPPG